MMNNQETRLAIAQKALADLNTLRLFPQIQLPDIEFPDIRMP